LRTLYLRVHLYTHPLRPFFFFNDPATPEIYTLSLHDALPISPHIPARSSRVNSSCRECGATSTTAVLGRSTFTCAGSARSSVRRSEEHTSELQSLTNLVCRLLLEKKKNTEFG